MAIPGKCKTILIVEDDDDIRNVMIDLLESEGYTTKAATNGKEALDALGSMAKPCLVLLDMMMPIMNGRQFLDTIMSDTLLAPIPVLIVSAVADKTNTEGSIGFLKKPIDIDVVLNVVSQYCK
ncbi:response regulator [Peredibacter sp. HCB2-198]|uniref:response regulator n=1 Tax=Peredibacter sp. HCB2-198 TaxID=3383025 RepID=UPI0038B635E0